MAAFNLTAQLNLVGPTNVRQIVSDIRRQIGSIQGTVDLKVDSTAAKQIAQISSQANTLTQSLAGTTKAGKDSVGSINQLNRAASSNNVQSMARDSASASKAIKSLGEQSRKSAKSAQILGNELAEFGRQSGLAIRRFAAFSLVSGVMYKLNSAVNQALSQFLDFDRELVRLSQVTGKSVSELDSLGQEITRLATATGVASQDLIAISSTLAQAGLSARDTEKALQALALSVNAPSFDNLSNTVEGSIALMRQFGIATKDLEKALGSINAVSAAFAVEAGDIISAISRTGGVFASASKGVSQGTDALNEFIAIFTSVRATTRESAETIATGLRTIFTRIQRGSTVDALKELGVELRDVEGQFVGPYEAVRRLSEGLGQLDPRSEAFSAIVEELGGFRQIGKVIPLIQQFATAEAALNVAMQGGDSLAEANRKAQASLAVQLAKTREEFVALIRDFANNSVFRGFLTTTISLTKGLLGLARAGKALFPLLTIIGGFKAISGITQFAGGFAQGVRPSGGKQRGGAAKGLGQGIGEALTGAKSERQAAALEKIVGMMQANVSGFSSDVGALAQPITALSTNVQQNIVSLTDNTSALTTATNAINTLIAAINSRGGGSALSVGGKVLGFSKGGTVPGSGKGDKVPAMLEPGEVVMSNRAVNKYGRGNLVRMNKYAGGGIIDDIGGVPGSTKVINANKKSVGFDKDTYDIKSSRETIKIVYNQNNQKFTANRTEITPDDVNKLWKNDPEAFATWEKIVADVKGATPLNTSDKNYPVDLEKDSDLFDAKFRPQDTYKEREAARKALSHRLQETGSGFQYNTKNKTITLSNFLGKTPKPGKDAFKDPGSISFVYPEFENIPVNLPQIVKELNRRKGQAANPSNKASYYAQQALGVVGNQQYLSGNKNLVNLVSMPKKRSLGGKIQKFLDGGWVKRMKQQDKKVLKKDLEALKSAMMFAGDTGAYIPSYDGSGKKEMVDPQELIERYQSMSDFVIGKENFLPISSNAISPIKKKTTTRSALKPAGGYSPEELLDAVTYYQGGSGPLARAMVNQDYIFVDREEAYETADITGRLSAAAQYRLPKKLYSGLGRGQFNEMLSDTQIDPKTFAKNPSKAVQQLSGQTVDFPTFLSTSKDYKTAEGFIGKPGALMSIDSSKTKQKGIDVLKAKQTANIKQKEQNSRRLPGLDKIDPIKLMNYDAEEEVVLNPNTKFKILSAKMRMPSSDDDEFDNAEDYYASVVESYQGKASSKKKKPETSEPDLTGIKLDLAAQMLKNGGKAKKSTTKDKVSSSSKLLTALQSYMAGSPGGVKQKQEPFGTGETKFPRRITNAYAKQLIKEQQEAEWKTLATNVPTDERIVIDDQAVASRMSEPFDRAAFLASFKGKVKRDSLFKSIGDFAKFIGLPQEDLSVALPAQIDFGNAGSIGRKVTGGGLFNDSPLGSRGAEGWDLSAFGYTDKDKQDLFGYEKLVEEKKKLQDKILKTPVETFDDGSFSYDREAFVSVFDEIKTLQKKISDIKGKERRAIEAAVESRKQTMSATGRGSISLGTAWEKPGQDVLYHELTHQLLSGLRARSAESFDKYKERVDLLFNTDNDGLADAFDALSSGNSGGYTSADVVYGRKYKQSLLESAQIQNIKLRDNPEKRNPELEKELASYIKASDGARKAREYRPINPGVNQTLLSAGFEQAHITRTEDNGKEEFLTTLVQKAPVLDSNLQSVLDSTLSELLGSAGIQRQGYKAGGMIQRFADAGAVKAPPRIRDRVSALSRIKGQSIQDTLIEQLKALGGPAGVRDILDIGSGDTRTRSVLNANNIKANKNIPQAKDYVNRALFVSGRGDAAEAKRIAGLTQVAIAGLLPMGYSDTNEWQLPESGKTIYATIKGFGKEYLSAAQQMSKETSLAARNFAENVQYIKIFGGKQKLVFDFDETLVSGADILNDEGKPDIPRYSDRDVVEEHLKKGRLTLLGEKLKSLIAADPEFIKNTRILTARPASTVDLLANSLQGFGLPYTVSDITGVGGPDVKVPKAKAQNLAQTEKLIDDSLDNIKAVQKSKKSGFLYTEPKAKPELDELMGQGNIEGAVIEKALAILGANLPPIETLESNRAVDFPGGLGRAAQFFGLPDNIPTEVKRTLNGSSFEKARGEFDRYYKDNAIGLADGGTVPALVSNGEAYVPPKLAQKIGYSTLSRMNQADRNGMGRFSDGGISVFRGPGTGTSDSIRTNLPVGSFILREKATKSLGLNRGGAVGRIQRFQTGGETLGRGAVADLDYIFSDAARAVSSLDDAMQEAVSAYLKNNDLMYKVGDSVESVYGQINNIMSGAPPEISNSIKEIFSPAAKSLEQRYGTIGAATSTGAKAAPSPEAQKTIQNIEQQLNDLYRTAANKLGITGGTSGERPKDIGGGRELYERQRKVYYAANPAQSSQELLQRYKTESGGVPLVPSATDLINRASPEEVSRIEKEEIAGYRSTYSTRGGAIDARLSGRSSGDPEKIAKQYEERLAKAATELEQIRKLEAQLAEIRKTGAVEAIKSEETSSPSSTSGDLPPSPPSTPKAPPSSPPPGGVPPTPPPPPGGAPKSLLDILGLERGIGKEALATFYKYVDKADTSLKELSAELTSAADNARQSALDQGKSMLEANIAAREAAASMLGIGSTDLDLSSVLGTASRVQSNVAENRAIGQTEISSDVLSQISKAEGSAPRIGFDAIDDMLSGIRSKGGEGTDFLTEALARMDALPQIETRLLYEGSGEGGAATLADLKTILNDLKSQRAASEQRYKAGEGAEIGVMKYLDSMIGSVSQIFEAEVTKAAESAGKKPESTSGKAISDADIDLRDASSVDMLRDAQITAQSAIATEKTKIEQSTAQRAELVQAKGAAATPAEAALIQSKIDAIDSNIEASKAGIDSLTETITQRRKDFEDKFIDYTDRVNAAAQAESAAQDNLDKAYADLVSKVSASTAGWDDMTDAQKASEIEILAAKDNFVKTASTALTDAKAASTALESERETYGGATNIEELRAGLEGGTEGIEAYRADQERQQKAAAERKALTDEVKRRGDFAAGNVSERRDEDPAEFKKRQDAARQKAERQASMSLGLTEAPMYVSARTKAKMEKEQQATEAKARLEEKKTQSGTQNVQDRSTLLLIQALNANTKAQGGASESLDQLEQATEQLGNDTTALSQAREQKIEQEQQLQSNQPEDKNKQELMTIPLLDSLEGIGDYVTSFGEDFANSSQAVTGEVSAFAGRLQRGTAFVGKSIQSLADGIRNANNSFLQTGVGKFASAFGKYGTMIGGAVTIASQALADMSGSFDTASGTALQFTSTIAAQATTFGTLGAQFGVLGGVIGTAIGAGKGFIDSLNAMAMAARERAIADLEAAKEMSLQDAQASLELGMHGGANAAEDFGAAVESMSKLIQAENALLQQNIDAAPKRDTSIAGFFGFGGGQKTWKTGEDLRKASREMAAGRAGSAGLSSQMLNNIIRQGNMSLDQAKERLGPQGYDTIASNIALGDSAFIEAKVKATQELEAGTISQQEYRDKIYSARDAAVKRATASAQAAQADEEYRKSVTEARKRIESQGGQFLEDLIRATPKERGEMRKNLVSAQGLLGGDFTASRAQQAAAGEKAYRETRGTVREKREAAEQAKADVRGQNFAMAERILSFGDQTNQDVRNAKANLYETMLREQGIDPTQGMAAEVIGSLRQKDPELDARDKNTEALLNNKAAIEALTAALENGERGNLLEDPTFGGAGEEAYRADQQARRNYTVYGAAAIGATVAGYAGYRTYRKATEMSRARSDLERKRAKGEITLDEYQGRKRAMESAEAEAAGRPRPATEAETTPSRRPIPQPEAPSGRTRAPADVDVTPGKPRFGGSGVGGRRVLTGLGLTALAYGGSQLLGGGGGTEGETLSELPSDDKVIALLAAIENNTRACCMGGGMPMPAGLPFPMPATAMQTEALLAQLTPQIQEPDKTAAEALSYEFGTSAGLMDAVPSIVADAIGVQSAISDMRTKTPGAPDIDAPTTKTARVMTGLNVGMQALGAGMSYNAMQQQLSEGNYGYAVNEGLGVFAGGLNAAGGVTGGRTALALGAAGDTASFLRNLGRLISGQSLDQGTIGQDIISGGADALQVAAQTSALAPQATAKIVEKATGQAVAQSVGQSVNQLGARTLGLGVNAGRTTALVGGAKAAGGFAAGTVLSAGFNAYEAISDPAAYDAKMRKAADPNNRTSERFIGNVNAIFGTEFDVAQGALGGVTDSLVGGLEGLVDPIGKFVESIYVAVGSVQDGATAISAGLKTSRMIEDSKTTQYVTDESGQRIKTAKSESAFDYGIDVQQSNAIRAYAQAKQRTQDIENRIQTGGDLSAYSSMGATSDEILATAKAQEQTQRETFEKKALEKTKAETWYATDAAKAKTLADFETRAMQYQEQNPLPQVESVATTEEAKTQAATTAATITAAGETASTNIAANETVVAKASEEAIKKIAEARASSTGENIDDVVAATSASLIESKAQQIENPAGITALKEGMGRVAGSTRIAGPVGQETNIIVQLLTNAVYLLNGILQVLQTGSGITAMPSQAIAAEVIASIRNGVGEVGGEVGAKMGRDQAEKSLGGLGGYIPGAADYGESIGRKTGTQQAQAMFDSLPLLGTVSGQSQQDADAEYKKLMADLYPPLSENGPQAIQGMTSGLAQQGSDAVSMMTQALSQPIPTKPDAAVAASVGNISTLSAGQAAATPTVPYIVDQAENKIPVVGNAGDGAAITRGSAFMRAVEAKDKEEFGVSYDAKQAAAAETAAQAAEADIPDIAGNMMGGILADLKAKSGTESVAEGNARAKAQKEEAMRLEEDTNAIRQSRVSNVGTYGLTEKEQSLVKSKQLLEDQKKKAEERGDADEAAALQKQIDDRQKDIEASRKAGSGGLGGNPMLDVQLYEKARREAQTSAITEQDVEDYRKAKTADAAGKNIGVGTSTGTVTSSEIDKALSEKQAQCCCCPEQATPEIQRNQQNLQETMSSAPQFLDKVAQSDTLAQAVSGEVPGAITKPKDEKSMLGSLYDSTIGAASRAIGLGSLATQITQATNGVINTVSSTTRGPAEAGTGAVAGLSQLFDTTALGETLQKTFGDFLANLQNIPLPKIPDVVTMEGKHTVEVIINGAEALKSIEPMVVELIDTKLGALENKINNITEGGFGP